MRALEHGLEQVALARRIATEAHAGQVDKLGVDYIEHPRRVAARLDRFEEQAVAWLHDVLEDTDVTADDLLAAGVDPAVVDAVVLLTRTGSTEPTAYYADIAADPLARAVKLADIADNTDPDRTARLEPRERERLAEKYRRARLALRRGGATKPVLYIDLDNTLVDFASGIRRLPSIARRTYRDRYDEAPGIFALMEPMRGAVAAFRRLAKVYDVYILSTAPWGNPTAWQHKLEWVQLHLGAAEDGPAYKRLILSHHKNLNRGAYLVDDRGARGADEFEGSGSVSAGTASPTGPPPPTTCLPPPLGGTA